MKFKFFCIFFIATEVLLLSLATWQYNRYQQKQAFLESSKLKMTEESVFWEDITFKDEYRHTLIKGSFDFNRSQLVAHQRMGNKAGFRLLTPFVIENSLSEVIVDRGFVPMQKLSQELIDSFSEENHQSVFGVVRFYKSKQQMFKSPDTLEKEGFNILLRKDPMLLEAKDGLERLPFYIQLDYPTAEALKAFVDQPQGNIPHFQYMMTWLTLAVLVALLYAFLLRSKFLTLRTPKS